MFQAYPAHRDRRTSIVLFYIVLVLIAAVYYLFLATDGSLNLPTLLERGVARGMTFNSMLEHLLHGEFDVDPAAIGSEGHLRDGKTYAYFGIIPALLRLPLLPIGALARLDVTGLYCALAATVALCFKLASVVLINDELPKSRLQAIAFFVLVLSLLLGGAQIQFLRSTIYQETIEWVGAISAAFIYCAVRGLIAKREFSTGLIAVMASLAGLGLLTRVSTALGLYVAVGLLVLVLAWPSVGPFRDRLPRFVHDLASKRTIVALTILLGFVTLSGIVNYGRWGNPLKFSGGTYIHLMASPEAIARLKAYGIFNIERLWYGILYYFFPIWTIIRPDGQFLFSEFETRLLDTVETPPSSFLLSDPLLLMLGGAFLLQLPRLARERLLDLRTVVALMIGFLVPVLLILSFCCMAFRYRLEFYPLLEFAGFIGFYAICMTPGPVFALSRCTLSLILISSAGFGIVYSHLLLLLYKISLGGNYSEPDSTGAVTPAIGWVDFYLIQLKSIFPSVAQRLHL
jgi:hypothetical protein